LTRRRLAFRAVLVVGLVWSAYPTLADAATASGPHEAAPVPTVMTASTSTVPPIPPTVPPAPVTTTPAAPPSTIADAPQPPATTAPEPPPPPEITSPPTQTNSAASPAPPPMAVAASALPCDGPGSELLTDVNADRVANGLRELCGNAHLASWAQNWATWMAQHLTFVHQDLQAMIVNSEFSMLAENILMAPASLSVAHMEVAWMNSPEHRANVLNPAYTAAGVGIATSNDGRVFAVVDFGG
jgi:uncharacterized protein YkwD